MKINYKDVITYIEKDGDITLLEYQKKALKAILENKNLFMPRGSGMSILLSYLGKYLLDNAYKPELSDLGRYSSFEYDVIITPDDVINDSTKERTLLNKDFFDRQKKRNKETFIKEFDILNKYEIKKD